MAKYIFINNKIVPEKDALISVFDRSYLYGEGAFETIRAYSGHIAFCDLHYERLKKNCKRLGIDLPIDKHGFEKAILKTINANNIKNAFVRVTVSPVGASYGIAKPKKLGTNLSIFCKEFNGKPRELYEHGAKVILVKVPSDHPVMANIKSTNYLYKMLARDEITNAGADEGIFCTPDGRALEGSATNLFIIKHGELYTTPIEDGVLPGITRNIVLQVAETAGIATHEASISLRDLQSCDEVFLTGSTAEVMPVRELVELSKKSGIPGPVTKKITEAYRALLP